MTNQDLNAEYRRLTLLQLLKADPDYRVNDVLLAEMLKLHGLGTALTVVRGDLARLEQLGLIATEQLAGCTLAILRSDGVDVADGVLTVPGIARPRPQ